MKAKPCLDCGAAPAIHSVEWTVALFDAIFSFLSRPIEILWRRVGRVFTGFSHKGFILPLFHFLAWCGLAKIVEKPDQFLSMRTKVLWDEADRRGIKMYELRLLGMARDFCVAEFEGERISFEGLPRPKGPDSESLGWMDNKSVMKKKFREAEIPVARGRACFSERSALQAFHEVGAPAIVKPHIGSRSRHTFIHIMDDQSLLRAFRSAKQLSFLAMIEEELQGFVFRITIVNKKVVAVMRREPPHVRGDGVYTVKELADAENKNPLREGPMFHHLDLGADAEEELRRQKLTWTSVPEKGEWVVLNQKVGRGSGASNADVTNEVHPDNIALFERIGQVLDDDLVGVDFIMNDMSQPWQDQMPCGVIECNSLPFIDLHYFPFTGQVQPVAGKIWDLIFPKSRPQN